MKRNEMEKLGTNKNQKVKKRVIKDTEKQLKKTFRNISEMINEEIKNADFNTFNEQDLSKLQKKIDKALSSQAKEIKMTIKSSVIKMIDSAVESNLKKYKKLDDKYKTNLYNQYKEKYIEVKSQVIKSVVNGELYKDNKKLSDRIWIDLKKNQSSIDAIIQHAIKYKEHPLDTAKKLEKYINPYAAKEFDWSKVYPNSKMKIEYNSLRLARTAVNHAHHQSVIEMAKRNPLVSHVQWLASHSHNRTCTLCSSRDGNIYPLSRVPQDHPNGMCDILEVTPDDETMEMLMDAYIESDIDDFEEFVSSYEF